MLAIVKILIQFGPDVVKMILDLAQTIQKAGAGKDRKRAERIIFARAWAWHNVKTPPPPPKK